VVVQLGEADVLVRKITQLVDRDVDADAALGYGFQQCPQAVFLDGGRSL